MAPVLLTLDSTAFDAINPSPTVQDSIISQWHHPTDIFSLLLLLGGDVVSRALAQLAGHGFTPVTFSFGWVSYSLSALASAVGENKLMPAAPDCKCKVINGKSGSIAENTSWILGRIVRDFDTWSHRAVKEKTTAVLTARWDELREKDPTAN